jgi:hypothetical protein
LACRGGLEEDGGAGLQRTAAVACRGGLAEDGGAGLQMTVARVGEDGGAREVEQRRPGDSEVEQRTASRVGWGWGGIWASRRQAGGGANRLGFRGWWPLLYLHFPGLRVEFTKRQGFFFLQNSEVLISKGNGRFAIGFWRPTVRKMLFSLA